MDRRSISLDSGPEIEGLWPADHDGMDYPTVTANGHHTARLAEQLTASHLTSTTATNAMAGTSTSSRPRQLAPSLERLVAEAMSLAATVGGAGPELANLVNRYWHLVPDDDIKGRTAAALLAATRAHLALAQQRLIGETKITVERTAERTVILVVTDDMPFLVDSTTAAVIGTGLDVELIVHPEVVVRREALGALTEVRPDIEPDEISAGETVESWILIETRALRDEAAVAALHNRLRQVLTDVREAVEDWSRMRQRALELADELASATLPVPAKDITDSVALLRWLAEDHFTFLGYREYRLVNGTILEAVTGTGLGILRQNPPAARVVASMSPEAYARVMEKRLLIITKATARATVHRPVFLDYIGFKIFGQDGTVTGERRFLGLFSSSAYLTSVRDLPVIKRKVDEVVDRSGLSPRSHSGKDLLAIIEDYPREELFQISTEDLYRTVMGVLRLAGRRQVKLFARKDQYGRFVSCLVYLPRDRFTTANRLRMQDILLRELNGMSVDWTTRVKDSTLARIHFIVRTEPGARLGTIDSDALSEQLTQAIRPWEDGFALTLEHRFGQHEASQLLDRYRHALPDGYKDTHDADEAARDVALLERLDEPGQLLPHLYFPSDEGGVRLTLFHYGRPMMLSDVLPVLHSLGVQVQDERPYEVERPDGTIYIYDFGLALPSGARDLIEVREHVEDAFAAAWRGESEVDNLNELVFRAGLTWRQVVVLRTYAKYLRQTGTVFSQKYMAATFAAYPEIAAQLLALFENRFDPNRWHTPEDRDLATKELAESIRHGLDAVTSLDQDRILRSYLTLIMATLRTSYFQRTADGQPAPYVAVKLDPQAIPDLPAPRPRYEIFVYSPRFEGVHLRFGGVARGGLRWSDRREDFRTEVLGLVKAQMVKNAVIVPEGAKGGFVVKPVPVAAAAASLASTALPSTPEAREAWQAEGITRYRQFVSALLDVTDNLVGGAVVPPQDVVRHDPDDTYLVVAADKGTATFSDLANEISERHGFWLGDAFASGGSAGYDHKKMGITARGAWTSVRRHFREMGINTQTQDFTVVGIGDMSGDVFGNGMLLSEHIRLVAAFDHRHIFVDPTPDAASSFVERRRLFGLPRSSWDDYDRSLMSPGGGVWSRSAKTIPVSQQMREALGIADKTVTSLPPTELVRAILTASVDLLWVGGIGTYVKASGESNAEAGDKANDAVRVNGKQVRATVVGEGGNLALTQRGRIEYDLYGGEVVDGVRQAHICTDFIDNSGGVDCSDHEVNIKILLNTAVADGELTRAERDDLLVEMTDEVAGLVLQDTYGQTLALGRARDQASALLSVHRRMLTDMERAGQIDRSLEALPTDEELAARAASGDGLTSPELAVLLAYTKIINERAVAESTLPDEAWTDQVLVDYFPRPLRQRYADRMRTHPLRREIVTTALVNETINRGGVSFIYRVIEETGASVADVVRAYVVVRDIYDLPALWQAVEALDDEVPAKAQTALQVQVRRLVDRAVRWLVTYRHSPIDVTGEIGRMRPGVSALMPKLSTLFHGGDRRSFHNYTARLVAEGIPPEVAEWASRVRHAFGLLDIVQVAQATGQDPEEVAGVYYVLSDRFRGDELLSKISDLPRDDRWQTMARMALRYDLYAALAALTTEVLAVSEPDMTSQQRAFQWEQVNAANLAQARHALGDFNDSHADLAALSVLLRQLRTLVRSSGS